MMRESVSYENSPGPSFIPQTLSRSSPVIKRVCMLVDRVTVHFTREKLLFFPL